MHPVPAVGPDERFAPARPVVREVLRGEDAAVLPEVLGDRFRDRSAVEDLRPAFGDGPEGRRQVRLPQHLPDGHRLAAIEEDAGAVGIAGHLGAEPAGGERPPHRRGHREAFLGVADRRRQHLRPGHRAAGFEERRPAGQTPGDQGSEETVPRRMGAVPEAAAPGEGRRVRRGRRGADEVQRADGLVFGVVEQRVPADAAQPGHERFDDREHRCAGDRGVEGVPARLQDAEPGLRRERMGGHHHPVHAHPVRAHPLRGRPVRGRAVHAHPVRGRPAECRARGGGRLPRRRAGDESGGERRQGQNRHLPNDAFHGPFSRPPSAARSPVPPVGSLAERYPIPGRRPARRRPRKPAGDGRQGLHAPGPARGARPRARAASHVRSRGSEAGSCSNSPVFRHGFC